MIIFYLYNNYNFICANLNFEHINMNYELETTLDPILHPTVNATTLNPSTNSQTEQRMKKFQASIKITISRG